MDFDASDFMDSNSETEPESLDGSEERIGTSPKELHFFEEAKTRRQLYAYDPLKDYKCIVNSKCAPGKGCVTASSGIQFSVTYSWDVPGYDLEQHNSLRNAQDCADKCVGYGTACQSFMFLKSGVLYGGHYRGRCWLKRMKTYSGTT